MAEVEGIRKHGLCEEGWQGGDCAYITIGAGFVVDGVFKVIMS